LKSTRIVAAVTLAVVGATAFALPSYFDAFKANYKIPKGTALDKAGCATCHVGRTTKLNLYGQDLKKAMVELKAKKVTADVLKKIESLDSDKDGVKNIDEIKAGTLPGDPKSK
jgi:cytochrome c553